MCVHGWTYQRLIAFLALSAVQNEVVASTPAPRIIDLHCVHCRPIEEAHSNIHSNRIPTPFRTHRQLHSNPFKADGKLEKSWIGSWVNAHSELIQTPFESSSD
jgi:hypothetical protein